VDLEKVVANLVHKIERRFYGKYRGFVVNNDDPKKLGRLELMVPSVLGPKVKTGWALPCVPYGGDVNQGFLCIPERGAGVWVEFEEGDLEFPIWVGTFWSEPGGKSELPKPNNAAGAEQVSVQSPPTRKIFKTKRGHTVQFEDADGEERIIICDGERENRIVFSKSGISIANKNNTIAMTNQGITINGAKKVCLDGLLTWLMNHTHVGNLGTPTPLNPADVTKLTAAQKAPDGDILSRRVTLG
jgi:hypothetical protein